MTKEQKEDRNLLVGASLVALIGMLSAPVHSRGMAWLAIIAVDVYLFVVLLLAALRTDDGQFKTNHPWSSQWFPRRTAGLFIVLLLLASIIFGFAGLYVGYDVFGVNKSWLDAIYISFQTLGFSDFGPKAGYGQRVVLTHLASGVLLMIGAFPLLISRISTFG